MQCVLATHNAGKAQEFSELFQGQSVQITTMADLGLDAPDEPGLTFVENAIIKARHAAKHTKLPVLADDSGVCVEAMNMQPGVITARYGGANITQAARLKKLLTEMEGEANRRTTFHCVLCWLRSPEDPAPIIAHGMWPGQLTCEPIGENGFGYDPVFIPDGYDCTAAQLDPSEKNRVSHRGRAFNILVETLKSNPAWQINK